MFGTLSCSILVKFKLQALNKQSTPLSCDKANKITFYF
jgi:hypothetical protein